MNKVDENHLAKKERETLFIYFIVTSFSFSAPSWVMSIPVSVSEDSPARRQPSVAQSILESQFDGNFETIHFHGYVSTMVLS
jgi:hypothetical protein